MRKKFFNYLNWKSLKKLIGIAFIGALIPLPAARALSYAESAGGVPCTVPTALTPVWAKLVLTGNDVTCYYALGAAKPTTWTQIGVTKTINFFNDPILVGMYVASFSNSTVSTGTIDNFSITPTPTYRLQDFDVGQPPLMGSANLINGVWNLSGSGLNIGSTFDQFNFQSWLVWGDCTVICRVTSISLGDPKSKLGIMIRDGFNSGSDFAMFCVKEGSGADFQYRVSFDNNADIIQYVAGAAVAGSQIGRGRRLWTDGWYDLHAAALSEWGWLVPGQQVENSAKVLAYGLGARRDVAEKPHFRRGLKSSRPPA